MEEQKNDTAPFVTSIRHKRIVCIHQVTKPYEKSFDITRKYLSDELPEWFAPLQAIVEDETFTSMDINLGERMQYHLSIEK